MFEIFQYGFIVRGLEAGIIVGLIAPLVGIFLVLRGYSLITDTLAHVSLAGIALAFLFGWSPIITALLVTVASSVGIDRLRTAKHAFGESALALFLSGSLALATILISLSHRFNTSLLNYLFGSIVTVTNEDIYTMLALGVVVFLAVLFLYKELVFVSFDESAAQVAGIPVRFVNTLFIILAATTVSLSIPVVGVLLIGALMIIPVLGALQLKLGFLQTILVAESISLASVISGIFISYYLNLATGGTIVLITLVIFSGLVLLKRFF